MKISLLYTTARPYLINDVIKRWFDSATDIDSFEFVIVTDDPFIQDQSTPPNLKFITNTGRRDCVTGWNLAAENASGDIFIQVSDDLFPPKGWDSILINGISQFSQKRPDIVMNLLDERKCLDAVYHPVLTRAAYEKLGYLYPPDFESMYCDNWLYAYHSKYSFYIVSQDKFWTHVHRTTHNVICDSVTQKHESQERYQRGRQTFEKYIRVHRLYSTE